MEFKEIDHLAKSKNRLLNSKILSKTSFNKNLDSSFAATLGALLSLNQSKHLISIADISKEEIDSILLFAKECKMTTIPPLLKGKILASCFFEPSTRTRLSFETAMLRLGGSVIGFADGASTSAKKGESLKDSIKVIGSYADVLVLRHPSEGSARLAADVAGKPVINGGDGANQHPTQTLVDLFSILECQGKIEDLHIAICGDLKFGRTVHSLALALAHYSVRLYFVAPESLSLPESIACELRKKGVKFSFHPTIEEILPKVDILYMTRLQKERTSDLLVESSVLKKEHLLKAKENLKILHPLPRIDEIETSIDNTPFAYYFQQAANAVPVRMATLASLMGKR